MICTPCFSDLHEFCRDDVRDCTCDCRTFYGFASLDGAEYIDVEGDEDADPDAWRVGQDRYERQAHGD